MKKKSWQNLCSELSVKFTMIYTVCFVTVENSFWQDLGTNVTNIHFHLSIIQCNGLIQISDIKKKCIRFQLIDEYSRYLVKQNFSNQGGVLGDRMAWI